VVLHRCYGSAWEGRRWGSRRGDTVDATADADGAPAPAPTRTRTTGRGSNDHGMHDLVGCEFVISINIVQCDDRRRRRRSTENPQTLLDRHAPRRSGAIGARRN